MASESRPEFDFDDLVSLAATVCGAPIAVVSLTAGSRHWHPVSVGLDECLSETETVLAAALGPGSDLCLVPDVRENQRFASDPLAIASGVRFYAAAAIPAADGPSPGRLAVLDRVPHELTAAQLEGLRALSRDLAAHLEIRRQVRDLDGALAGVALAEDALRQAMAGSLRATEVRTLVDNVADGFITYGEGGAIEIFNKAAERIFGYSSSEIVGRSIELLMPGSVEMKDGFHAETEGRRADGGRVPLDVAVSEMFDGGRNAFIAVVRDVTLGKEEERRHTAEHAVTRILAESVTIDDAAPRILAALVDALGWKAGVFWSVQPGTPQLRRRSQWTANSAAPGLLAEGFEPTLSPGTGLAGRVWESGRPEWVADTSSSGEGPGSVAGLRAGVAFPVAVGGEVLGIVELWGSETEEADEDWLKAFFAMGVQIGQFVEREESDRALHATDERMKAVIENMLEGLITVNEDTIIEQVNAAAEHMFGYAAWELVGQHLKILMPESTSAHPDSFLRDAARRALGRISEWEGRRKNGDPIRFELSLFAFQTPDGRHFAGHLRDISERKKLERMKQEFVATVSHELRTPLASIRGSLGLLAGGALGSLPDEALEVVTIAERNTERLIALINDILDLERVEAGKLELNLAATSLDSIVARSLEAVQAFAEQQGVTLEWAETAGEVFGDHDRLVQVVVNLLSNAVKFSPRGAAVSVSVAGDAEQAELRVLDRGRGIPPQHREAIFERFRQVEASDSRQKGGTGLGLAICKAIVEQHGGSIGVESEVGRGSTFWLRIPTRPAGDRSAKPDRFLEALSGQDVLPGDVLLADHDAAILSVLSRQLLQDGIPVRTARTAAETLTEIARKAPALLVLDVGLPDASAFSVIETLRGRSESQIPTLIYTGRDLTEEDRERLTLGPTRFLTKSKASDAQFRGLVLELLASWRTRSA